MTKYRAAVVVLAALSAAIPALAQTPLPPATPPGAATPAAPVSPPGPPPYDDQLLRLSEILGAVHYLRQICGTNEGSLWRDQMQALIDSELPDALRRARMVDRFNRGFDSYQAVYRACTGAARLTIDRYLTEGAKIAADVAARYGK